MSRVEEFERDLTSLINRHSLEHTFGDTPDFVLARYVVDCLDAFEHGTRLRGTWYGSEPTTEPDTTLGEPIMGVGPSIESAPFEITDDPEPPAEPEEVT